MVGKKRCDKCGKPMNIVVTIGNEEDDVGHIKALQCQTGGCNRLWNAVIGFQDVGQFLRPLERLPKFMRPV